MNSKGTWNSIGESGGSTIGEELVQRPLHSDHGLNSISRFDFDETARSNVKLKNILKSKESIFSTFASLDLLVFLSSIVIIIWRDKYIVCVYAEGACIWVKDS